MQRGTVQLCTVEEIVEVVTQERITEQIIKGCSRLRRQGVHTQAQSSGLKTGSSSEKRKQVENKHVKQVVKHSAGGTVPNHREKGHSPDSARREKEADHSGER